MKIINKPLTKGAKSQIPNRIIVHAMGEYIFHDGKYKHAADFLRDIGLSAHVLICPDGSIIRCREDNQGAYHARKWNSRSLGVEFLLRGKHNYVSFTRAIENFYLTFDQHFSGVELLRDWCSKHDIVSIDRHSDLDPERKVDPGNGFPFDLILKDIENGRYCK